MFHSIDSLNQFSVEQLEQALLKRRLDESKSLTVEAYEYDIRRDCVFSVVKRSSNTDDCSFMLKVDSVGCEFQLTNSELQQLQYLIDIALGKINQTGKVNNDSKCS